MTSNESEGNAGDGPRPGALVEPTPHAGVLEIRISGRSVWQIIGAILLTLSLLWAANKASTLVALIAMSFFFSLALDPAVRRLVDRFEWRRGSATGVIYLGGGVLGVFLISVISPAIAQLASLIGEQGAQWLTDLSEWTATTFGFEFTTPDSASDLAESADVAIRDWADNVFGAVIGIATTGISLIFNMATIAMFTFYFTAEAPAVQRAVLRLFTPNMQQRIGWTWDQAIIQTGGYFYSRMILMGINGLGFFFTMVAVGMPVAFALSLAIFGAFVSVFIPAIGTYIGGAVPIVLTLAIQGFTAALIVLGYVLLYQQVENYWLSPRISANTMTLNGGVAFGAALAGGAIGGPMGAFVALPVAALIASFVANYVASHEVVYQSTERPPKESKYKLKFGRGGKDAAASPDQSAT